MLSVITFITIQNLVGEVREQPIVDYKVITLCM